MTADLSSIPAIVATTILAVDFIKRSLGNVRVFAAIPTWLYSVAVAATLTVVANRLLHSLQGDLLDLAWQAVTNAATASGIYEWLNHHNLPLGVSADKKDPASP
jgi:hypothetical protein